MTPDEKETLVSTLRRCFKSKKQHYYWICPKGEDGEPLMLIERKSGPLRKAAKNARKTAKLKIAATGPVLVADGDLVFVNEGKLDNKKVLKLFKTKLATDKDLKKLAAMLRSAKIYDPAEFAALGVALDAEGEGESAADLVDRDGDDFDALYTLANDEVGVIHAAIGNSQEFGGKVGMLRDHLRAAATEYDEAGEDPTAIAAAVKKVQQVLGASPKLIDSAWTSERTHVAAALKGFLAATPRESPNAARVPEMQALWATANSLKSGGRWVAALEALERLGDMLDDLANPLEDPSAEDVEAAFAEDEPPTAATVESVADMAQRVSARKAYNDAVSIFLALDEPSAAEPSLMAAREQLAAANYSEVHRILEQEYFPAIASLDPGPASLRVIATARLGWEGAVKKASTQVLKYQEAVLADKDLLDAEELEALRNGTDSLADLVPEFGSGLGDAIDVAINASGQERVRALAEASKIALAYKSQILEDPFLPVLRDSAIHRTDAFATLISAIDEFVEALP